MSGRRSLLSSVYQDSCSIVSMQAPKTVLNSETHIFACKVSKTVYCKLDEHVNLLNSQAAGRFKHGSLLCPALWTYRHDDWKVWTVFAQHPQWYLVCKPRNMENYGCVLIVKTKWRKWNLSKPMNKVALDGPKHISCAPDLFATRGDQVYCTWSMPLWLLFAENKKILGPDLADPLAAFRLRPGHFTKGLKDRPLRQPPATCLGGDHGIRMMTSDRSLQSVSMPWACIAMQALLCTCCMQCVIMTESCNFCSTTLTLMRFAPVLLESTGTSAFHHDKVQNLSCHSPKRLDEDAHQPTDILYLWHCTWGKIQDTVRHLYVFHSHSCLRPLRLVLLIFTVRSPHDACQKKVPGMTLQNTKSAWQIIAGPLFGLLQARRWLSLTSNLWA